jgi:glycosyltransferase involved in cell wall biosynthesis
MKSVLVITPTIGSPELSDCVRSVLAQDYDNVQHLVVIDGPEFKYPAMQSVNEQDPNGLVKVLTLPYNTGAGGWYGDRIMAGLSYLVNHDYVMFLDQDNMIEPDHVSTMVAIMEKGYDWSYSLRKVYSKEGEFICEDDCESLGWWPIYGEEQNGNLVDTSCYFFSNKFLRETGHLWNWGWGADRRFYEIVVGNNGHANFACSKKSTLLYRLGGNDGSVKREFFEIGNAHVWQLLGGNLPWRMVE